MLEILETITARTIGLTHSLLLGQRPSTYFQGNMGKFWGDWRWSGKSSVLVHKNDNISERRKFRRKVTTKGL